MLELKNLNFFCNIQGRKHELIVWGKIFTAYTVSVVMNKMAFLMITCIETISVLVGDIKPFSQTSTAITENTRVLQSTVLETHLCSYYSYSNSFIHAVYDCH